MIRNHYTHSKKGHSHKPIGLTTSLLAASLYLLSLGSCGGAGSNGSEQSGDNPTQAGEITSLVASPTEAHPNDTISFTATIDYNEGGTDTLSVDPDGTGPLDPVTTTYDVPYGGASGLEKTVEASYPSTGTYTPSATLDSNPDYPITGNDVTITQASVYKSVESIILANDSANAGEIKGEFYNPSATDTTAVTLYASYFDSDIETLLSNGDAWKVDTIAVDPAQTYQYTVTGLDSDAVTTLYHVPGDGTTESYTDTAQASIASSGMPEVGHSYEITFEGATLPDGTDVTFIDKYNTVRERVSTIDNMVAGSSTQVAENLDLQIIVDGYGSKDTFTYTNQGTYSKNINL